MGSSPIVGFVNFHNCLSLNLGQCPEWQRGRTVTPLATAFAGSSPAWPIIKDIMYNLPRMISHAHVAQG